MECIIGFGTTIITEVAKCTLVSVIPAFHYQIDVNELNRHIEEFESRKKELQDQVDAAKRVGDIILDNAQKWVGEADALSQEVEDFRKDERQRANHRCFYVSFPNLVSRHRLSKRAKKLAEKLVSQIEAAPPVTQVSTPPALQTPLEMIGDYMAFQSRKETLESIMDALKNPEVRRIGVYGMGGIGKTMLAKEVARRAENEKLFSEVAMPSVSQIPDIHKIQQEIAEKLRLTSVSEVQSTQERANRLQRQLKEKKDILIILDDIWERLDLIEVGIHFDQDQKGCKILLTSRVRDCVSSSMNAEKCFQVEELSSDEAADLFNRFVGDTLVGRLDLQQRATEVVRECGGLPIALTTVARALKDKNLQRWDDALQRLRSSSLKSIPGMSKDVYKSIKLSYDFLEDNDERSLLLLCSLHEEDVNIDVEDLMRYCVGWGLFPNIRKLEDARTRVHSLVEILKDRSLLLDGNYYGRVKMHDIIRDVAISISSEDERGMRSVMFDELEDRMKRKELSNSKAISVHVVDNPARLPEKLECPRLELLLFMTRNARRYDSTCISADFFAESKELKTLSWLPFLESMPSSFLSLQNLQTVRLRYSKLKDVDFIGDLKNLRILDLSDSSIERFSRKMGQLTNLQLLDLRRCKHLEVIEPDAIRNLTRLEELYIAETFQGWEVGEDGIGERRNASLTDLQNLHQLTVLYLKVEDAEILPREFFSKKLNRYGICIGDSQYSLYAGEGISRLLHLKLNQWSQLIEFGTEWLIKRCEKLFLDGLMGIRNAFSDLDSKGFPQLKHLGFCNNNEVQYILSSVDHPGPYCHAFLSLKTLNLSHLENLERICQGKLPPESLNNLREVHVDSCDRLKNLLPLYIVKRLYVVRVLECEMMEEIVTPGRDLDAHSISNNEGDHEVESFELLRSLRLSSLPKFVQFCSCALEAACGSSSPVDSPKHLFSKKVLFPNLEDLYLSGMRVENLWPMELQANSYMENIKKLEVKCCNNLKYLFSFIVNERLVNLKKLRVDNCTVIEDILVIKREGIGLKNILFPKLEYLGLSKLPTLKRYCAVDSCIEFPSLLRLCIEGCPELKKYVMPIEVSIDNKEVNPPLFNEKVLFPNLEDLYLSRMRVVNLWPEELQVNSYMKNLTSLEVKSCNSLKYLFSFAVNERLVNLKELRVDNCTAMEDIVVPKREGIGLKNILFPKLEYLMLSELPALKSFCAAESYLKFPSLLQLNIESCPKLKTFVMPIQVSIDNKEVNLPLFNEKVLFPNLEDLYLSGTRVENLLPEELQASFYMKNLTSLEVDSCNNLKYLFSFAVIERLVNLKKLEVDNCTAMEDIVVTKREKGIGQNNIHFPKLEDLTLRELPALKSFCVLDSCIEFSSLLLLNIESCPELKTFVTPIQILVDSKEVNLPLFTEKVIFRNLETLTCSGWCEAVNEIFGMSQSSIMSGFRNLKYLTVRLPSHDKPIAISIFNFLQRYQNIETLDLSGFVLDEKLCEHHQKQEDGTYKLVGTPLKRLRLSEAPKRRHLFGDPENFEPLDTIAFQTLEYLNVGKCSRLQSFSLSVMSFHNLKTLLVSECHGLTYLFAPATAATLVHLEEMMIIDCKGMREIIYKEGEITEGEHDEFVFKRLERLVLSKLPSFKSIFSGNKVINFPSLKELSIRHCPELSNFSRGIISTSGLLKAIIAENGVKFWDNDVNTTVRKLWEDSSNLELEHLFAHET